MTDEIAMALIANRALLHTLSNPTDRRRIVFVERDGETHIGYVPRNTRGPTPSRAERNRMARFAGYVWGVRRLPFRIRCIAPAERCVGQWTVSLTRPGATFLPLRAAPLIYDGAVS